MVTKEYMALSARKWFRRKGNAMARAMLRALGVPEERGDRLRGTHFDIAVYDEMKKCFENRESPMDGRALA